MARKLLRGMIRRPNFTGQFLTRVRRSTRSGRWPRDVIASSGSSEQTKGKSMEKPLLNQQKLRARDRVLPPWASPIVTDSSSTAVPSFEGSSMIGDGAKRKHGSSSKRLELNLPPLGINDSQIGRGRRTISTPCHLTSL